MQISIPNYRFRKIRLCVALSGLHRVFIFHVFNAVLLFFSVTLKAFWKPTNCLLILEFKVVCAQVKDKKDPGRQTESEWNLKAAEARGLLA